MKIRKNGRILNNRETPKIMPYKSAITPPLLSNSQIDSCLSRDIYINNSNVGERGRNKILGNFIGTTKKKKWINESYAQPNDNNHLKINTKDLIRTPTFPPSIHI